MKSSQISPEYLDLKGAARYSSISVRTWREILKKEGGPPHIRLRGKILLYRPDIDRFLNGLKCAPSDQVDKVVDAVIGDLTWSLRRVN